MGVTYKKIGDDCHFILTPLYSGEGEIMTLSSSRKRETAKSGLLLKNAEFYPLGTLLQLDIKFSSDLLYRARTIVSWVGQELTNNEFEIGLTIVKMTKLDADGFELPKADIKTKPQPRAEENLESFFEEELSPEALPSINKALNKKDSIEKAETLILEAPKIDPAPGVDLANEGMGDFTDEMMTPNYEMARTVLERLVSLFPEKAFGEKVYCDEVFVLSKDELPLKIQEVIKEPALRMDFRIGREKPEAKICLFLPEKEKAPDAETIINLLASYTGKKNLQVVRISSSDCYTELSFIARIASDYLPVKAVLGMNAVSIERLIPFSVV